MTDLVEGHVDVAGYFEYKKALNGDVDMAVKVFKRLQAGDKRYGEYLHFYQNVLMNYKPADAVKILVNDEYELLTTEGIEYEYLLAIFAVATVLSRNNQEHLTARWAKKGILLYKKFIVNFGPSFSDYASEIYERFTWLQKKYSALIDEDQYDNYDFEWEEEYFKKRNNDK